MSKEESKRADFKKSLKIALLIKELKTDNMSTNDIYFLANVVNLAAEDKLTFNELMGHKLIEIQMRGKNVKDSERVFNDDRLRVLLMFCKNKDDDAS